MNPRMIALTWSVVGLAGLVRAAPAEASADRATVHTVMQQVADYQLAHPGKEPPDGWVQGAFYAGLSAFANQIDSSRYHDALAKIGEKNGWKLGERVLHADDICVGQMYLEMYERDHDPRKLAAMQERCDYLLAHPQDDNLEFVGPNKTDRWSWCDALFMAPPAWMRLYRATGNKAYLDYAVEKWWKTSDYLYDPAEHLFFRDSTYFNLREANGKKIFWSRGNGWVLAGLARVLEILPADHPARPRFEQQFKDMAEKIRTLQLADGAWRSSLLDPASCHPLKETSGTGFFCFGFAWGVNHGLLNRATFAPAAQRAWSTLVGCVEPTGKLTYVQPIGAAPKSFPPESTEAYGPGAFLLAGTEIARLGL